MILSLRYDRALVCLLCSCGYQPIYANAGVSRLHVELVRTLVPDAVASDEVVSGMREELARLGALETGAGYPRAEVEVLRADDVSEGVAAVGGSPKARATDVTLVARAWIVSGPGQEPENDTGDVRAQDVIAIDETGSSLDLRASAFTESDALRAAGHRLGQALARKLMHVATSPPY